MEMVNDLEAIKKKRRFLRKSVTDTLKSIDEALSIPDNHARIQVLKDNTANKCNDLQEVQATMYTLLEERERLTKNVRVITSTNCVSLNTWRK